VHVEHRRNGSTRRLGPCSSPRLRHGVATRERRPAAGLLDRHVTLLGLGVCLTALPHTEDVPCVFCGSPGPLTDEHAIPQWAKKAIGATEGVRLHVVSRGSRTLSPATDRPAKRFTGMRVVARKAICDSCNTGWLAALESEVSPLLSPALRGDPIKLSLDQQALVAFWATKTSLMIEVAHRQFRTESVMPASHLRWLNEHRADCVPPPGTVVWLASLNPWLGDDFVPTWCSSGTLRSGDPRHPNGTSDSYVATFSVGCLIFEVIGQDFREPDHLTPTGLPFVTVIPPRELAPYLLAIWPQFHPVAAWPPNYVILAEDWPEFAEWYTALTWFHRNDPVTRDVTGVFLAEGLGALPVVGGSP
jgi:hypothetical protein